MVTAYQKKVLFTKNVSCYYSQIELKILLNSDAKNMAVDVRNIILKTVQEKGGRTEAEAVQFLKKLESMKKYSADVWS